MKSEESLQNDVLRVTNLTKVCAEYFEIGDNLCLITFLVMAYLRDSMF